MLRNVSGKFQQGPGQIGKQSGEQGSELRRSSFTFPITFPELLETIRTFVVMILKNIRPSPKIKQPPGKLSFDTIPW